VKLRGQPVVQALSGLLEINIANAGLLEAEFTTPRKDLRFERSHIGIAVLGAGLGQCRFQVG
jgi:hypothetical protein